jgi:hypothetical protein
MRIPSRCTRGPASRMNSELPNWYDATVHVRCAARKAFAPRSYRPIRSPVMDPKNLGDLSSPGNNLEKLKGDVKLPGCCGSEVAASGVTSVRHGSRLAKIRNFSA